MPVLRALLSVSTACNRAGLAPGRELDVSVRPAEPLSPQSASSQLFDAAPESERSVGTFRFGAISSLELPVAEPYARAGGSVRRMEVLTPP